MAILGKLIDNIESNISSIAVDTSGAAEELSTASEYQRKAGRRAACLMIIMVVVICVVLIAVSQLFLSHPFIPRPALCPACLPEITLSPHPPP